MKIKISMDTNSNPPDDEIRSYMNFDRLVEDVRKGSGKRKMRKIWLALPVGLVLLSLWPLLHRTADDKLPLQHSPVGNEQADRVPDSSTRPLQEVVTDETAGVKPALAPDTHSSTLPAHDATSTRNRQARDASGQPPGSTSAGDGLPAPTPDRPERASGSVPPGGEKDVYVQAVPRDGYTHLYAYFGEHLVYPPQAIKDSISGIETISFTIDEQGRPSGIVITKSLGAAFDAEALRLIDNMPAWQPATLNGRPVASQLSLPLTFQLKRIERP